MSIDETTETMTPNELPQTYVLMKYGRPLTTGTSLDSLKAEGTRLFNENPWGDGTMTVDDWLDVDNNDKYPEGMVAVYFGHVIYKVESL